MAHVSHIMQERSVYLSTSSITPAIISDLRQMEDMDISPGSTPTEESMMEQRCASLGQTPSYLSHTPSHHRHPIITRMPSVSPHTPASSAASASVTPTSMAMLQSISQSNDKSSSVSQLMQKNNQQITQQGWFAFYYKRNALADEAVI